ncbi:MAG: hypothetical protein WBG37_12465 [Desulfobacterales bacterium]
MNPQDQRRIIQWCATLDRTCTIQFYTTEDSRSRPLQQFCDALQALAPQIRVVKDEPLNDALPSIDLGFGIRYRAVPEEKELAPFLDLLSGVSAPELEAGGAADTREAKSLLPAHFELFIAPQCPFCPQAVTRLANWTRSLEMMKLTIVDGMLFDDLARARKVRSVPMLFLERDFSWRTMPSWAELEEVMANRDPARLGPAALEDYLSDGRASGLAALMLAQGVIFPAYLELLTHSRWPTRLGAMVAFEYIAEADPALAQGVIEPLCGGFDGLAETVQGDVLQVLATAGGPSVQSFLASVRDGGYGKEVRTAARETLAEMAASRGEG